jgi:hypothetical protein
MQQRFCVQPASLHWICSGRFFYFSSGYLILFSTPWLNSKLPERITAGFLKLFAFLFWIVQLKGLQPRWSFIPKSAAGGGLVLGEKDLETLWRRMECFYLFSLFRVCRKMGREGFQVFARKSEVKSEA